MTDFIRRIKADITRAGSASTDVLARIDEEIERAPSAALWVLRGDALQVMDVEDDDLLDEVVPSYEAALELDPDNADAYESLGHFTLSMLDDARGAVEYFRAAIARGAGESAREGLREAEEELREIS